MIARNIKERLEKTINSVPAVALLGARQVGKTTLAKEFLKESRALYLDLESPEDLLKLSDPISFFRLHNDKLIIIDEIQRSPELFSILRGVIDQNRQEGKKSSQFLLLGSASMDLLRQSSESLAGRISYIEMNGLNLFEINSTREDTNMLWLRGGFPDSFLAAENSLSIDWRENLIRTYLERDVPQMGFQVPANRLRRLWTMLAHLQGETINVSKIANSLEVKRSVVNHYIDILTDLLLVRRLEPWHANVKKRLVKSPRYYVRDSGILHRLLSINSIDSLLSNPILGKSWEGFVIENIYSVIPPHSETYFYRTAAGAEIDLLIKMPSSEIWAIEIKYGVAPKIGKHYSQTCDDVGAKQKYVIYGGKEEFPASSDVNVISLMNLMEKLRQISSNS